MLYFYSQFRFSDQLLINPNSDAEHLCRPLSFPTEKLDQELISEKGMIRRISKILSVLIINDLLFIDVSLIFSWSSAKLSLISKEIHK